ncbi:ABC transporter family substrate-binding protein [Bifidobacterium oedipodis]|uniref:ABC transporter substrate-binding protein n=1 Tax=Bifidobacterium oedipodis TaxID=2675322 RepID=A0A7Y0EPV4_9BIFI|nr:ABC transporter family substrate-binding protein [Bifidobacterium sp. DSM 109957]NMM93838.1 ABC transporter substrate-binding protein [Bifidobacterium sp. DSM 109957]
MNSELLKRLSVASAAVAAFAMLVSGCGATNNGEATNDAKVGAAEPASGFESDYQGQYSMPDPDKAYNNPQDSDNIKDGGELHMATTYTPNWNSFSVEGNTGYMSELWSWYMPSLVKFDLKGNMTWNKDYITDAKVTNENPLTVTYTINDKANWNDGTPIDWTAFKSTWEVMNGSNPAYNPPSTDGYSSVKSVEQGANAKQAVVTFASPYYPWQSVFTGLYPPQATDPKVFTEGWIDNPHSDEWGAGPFTVQKADKDGATFVRNSKWWGATPKLEKITYKYMEDTAMLNAFKNGEIDSVSFSNANSLKTVRGRKDSQIRLGYGLQTNVYVFNGSSGPLKDVNVRKALNQAYDRETMNKIHFQGLNWTPEDAGSEVFPIFQKGYEDNRPEAAKKLDVEGAKKTLESAGYKMGDDGYFAKDGKTLDVRFTYFGDSATTTAIAKAYQQMMKAAGIKITLDNKDNSKWADTMNNHDYDVTTMAWQANSPWGQLNMTQLYGSKSESNFSFVGSDEIDKLAKVPGTIENQDEAVKAANKAEKAALELYGTMPMDVPAGFYAVTKGLANWGPAGFTSTDPTLVGWQK